VDRTNKYKRDRADKAQGKYKTQRQAPGLPQKAPRDGVAVRSNRGGHRFNVVGPAS
jgi:hypothetical protein